MAAPLLEVKGVSIRFGGVMALDDVSLVALPAEILSIIGPNGAGKTTLFNVISGLCEPARGEIRLAGEDVTRLPSHELAKRGLSRTFQNLQIFFRMSVVDNVMAGNHLQEQVSLLSELLSLPSARRQNEVTRAKALGLLEQVGLRRRADHLAGDLAYGELKRLEIARALAMEPRVMMLDEPAAGCNAIETRELDELIRRVAQSGTAIVLVEHDMRLVMNISDRVLVLDQGRKLAEGRPSEVRSNSDVIAAYLGIHGAKEAALAQG
jgi:branched-chain amino acid transport system ATP-binding protein